MCNEPQDMFISVKKTKINPNIILVHLYSPFTTMKENKVYLEIT